MSGGASGEATACGTANIIVAGRPRSYYSYSYSQMRAYHDLGGLPGGPIDRTEHDAALWEKRVHAMLGLLAERQVISVDELRHGIETLGEAEYSRLTYYERWIESITRALVQRGVLTTDELGRKLAEIEGREP